MLVLVRLRRKIVEFFQLILQQFATRLALLRQLLMLRQIATALMPGLIVAAHLAQQIVMAGVGVKQVFLMVGFKQQLVSVLAVDLNQQLAQIPQLRQRHRGTVDKAA